MRDKDLLALNSLFRIVAIMFLIDAIICLSLIGLICKNLLYRIYSSSLIGLIFWRGFGLDGGVRKKLGSVKKKLLLFLPFPRKKKAKKKAIFEVDVLSSVASSPKNTFLASKFPLKNIGKAAFLTSIHPVKKASQKKRVSNQR